MKKKIATVTRETKETQIKCTVNVWGTGKYNVKTGIGFLDHMLELFSKHSLIDLDLEVKGDLKVDEHHAVEDTALVLGEAINKALGDKKGIKRYGFLLPMDEALTEVAIDLGGRPYLVFNCKFNRDRVGDLPTELVEDFFYALASTLKAAIHINLKYGRNEHHKIEGIFKAFAHAMRNACDEDFRAVNKLPSTKGVL